MSRLTLKLSSRLSSLRAPRRQYRRRLPLLAPDSPTPNWSEHLRRRICLHPLPGRHVPRPAPRERHRDNLYNPTFLGIQTSAACATLTGTPLRSSAPPRRAGLLLALHSDGLLPRTTTACRPLPPNAGIRYEFSSMPKDHGPRPAVPNLATDTAPTVGSSTEPTSLTSCLALASPGTSSATVKHRCAAHGLFFNTNNQQQSVVTNTNPLNSRVSTIPHVPRPQPQCRCRQYHPPIQ